MIIWLCSQGWGGPAMNQGPPPNMMGGPGKGPGPQPNVPPQTANPTAGPRPHTSPHYLKQHLQVCELQAVSCLCDLTVVAYADRRLISFNLTIL